MKYYILTIKNNTKPCDKYGIDKIYSKIYNASDFNSDFTYENDSHMKLHAHAIVGFKNVPHFQFFCSRKGYHVYFQKFPEEDIENVRKYLRKEEDALYSNHYYNNYSMVY